MGDFVSRGWQSSVREGLDKLLNEALVALLSTSSAGKEAISQAPCQVISIRPGVIAEQGVLAVVMPSQDRVGRTFPLCVGVHWDKDNQGNMGWPSVEYAKVVVEHVRRCLDGEPSPESLLAEVVAAGNPRQHCKTFNELGSDETLPRMGAETKLLHVGGGLAAMPVALKGLCSMLGDASDLLGIRLDLAGEAQDFFVCRRIESGAPLAAMFDGDWSSRGWLSYVSSPQLAVVGPESLPNLDEDATRPRHRPIDIGSPPPDSHGVS